ncbi:MAG TPA: MEDS domain-containing protein [Bryobacteraceae bacterium]|nr:MEDS domain-containing protein [Bryobacteraceae bacterium]
MSSNAAPIYFAGSQFGDQRHVCAFFSSPDEKYRVLLPFIKDGFDHGDRAFHVVDPDWRKAHLQRLESAGIDTARAESSGQLKVCGWNQAHLDPHGRFDQYRMISLIEEELKLGATQGFTVSRSIGHMEWALENPPGAGDLVEYEARLNYVLPRYHDPVICVYDITKFSGDVIVDILRTHPMVIIGATIQENPFFVPPDEFLRELREKRVGQNQ